MEVAIRDFGRRASLAVKPITTLRPVPSRALKAAMFKDPETVWVKYLSPRWLRIAVNRRANAFKREFRYDFVQWEIYGDPDAIAYLFSDGEPYPKSKALASHKDAISTNTESCKKVKLEHFVGISPRRYRDIFEKGKRRGKDGEVLEWYKAT